MEYYRSLPVAFLRSNWRVSLPGSLSFVHWFSLPGATGAVLRVYGGAVPVLPASLVLVPGQHGFFGANLERGLFRFFRFYSSWLGPTFGWRCRSAGTRIDTRQPAVPVRSSDEPATSPRQRNRATRRRWRGHQPFCCRAGAYSLG